MAAKFKNIKDKFQKLIERADYLPRNEFKLSIRFPTTTQTEKETTVFS